MPTGSPGEPSREQGTAFAGKWAKEIGFSMVRPVVRRDRLEAYPTLRQGDFAVGTRTKGLVRVKLREVANALAIHAILNEAASRLGLPIWGIKHIRSCKDLQIL
jgi:hypothetical protein